MLKLAFYLKQNDKISLPKVQHVKLPCTLKTPFIKELSNAQITLVQTLVNCTYFPLRIRVYTALYNPIRYHIGIVKKNIHLCLNTPQMTLLKSTRHLLLLL